MHICIVTTGQLGSNPRVVKEADALSAAGHDVTVICTKVAEFVEPRDRAVMARASFAVRRISFDHPVRWRALRLRQILAGALCRIGLKKHFAANALSAMTPSLMRAALAVPADLYIAHYPPALAVAARAASIHRSRYAFDAEDFHLGDLPDRPEHEFDKALIRSVEGRYLPKATYLTAASPMIAIAYAECYDIPAPTTLLNVFPRANAPKAPTSEGSYEPGPTLYWFSQVIGPGRGLETAIRAIGLTRTKVHLHLRGTPARGFAVLLQGLAREFGVLERLHLLDPIAPDALEGCGAHFDLGYAGDLCETRNRQIALTNKLFSYLSSGLPIIASDIPSHRGIADELGLAVTLFPVDDAQALAAAIDSLCVDSEKLATARRHAWELGQGRFSWELECSKLLERIREVA